MGCHLKFLSYRCSKGGHSVKSSVQPYQECHGLPSEVFELSLLERRSLRPSCRFFQGLSLRFLSRASSFSAECIQKGSNSVCVWNSCAMSRATSCTDHVARCTHFLYIHLTNRALQTKHQTHNSENFAPIKKQTPTFSTNNTNNAWKTKFIQISHTGKEKKKRRKNKQTHG